MNDNEIIELYWKRSETAIEATAEKYGSYLTTISHNILGNHSDAEECVNDTYCRAWETIPPTRPLSLPAYLGRITRNLSVKLLRRRSTKKRGANQIDLTLSELEDCIPSVVSLEQDVEDQAVLQEIHRFLYAQSSEKQILFVQRYWYVLSVKEIAARNGLSKTNVTSILHRMRKELKAYLETEGICS